MVETGIILGAEALGDVGPDQRVDFLGEFRFLDGLKIKQHRVA